MKILSSAFIVFSIVASIVHGGSIETDQSIDFTNADFAGGNTASKEFVINSEGSDHDTNVFEVKNMMLGDDGRMCTAFGDQPVEYYVVYKITTPPDAAITKFTFALKKFSVAGALGGGNVVSFQYSSDGETFTDFFSRENRAGTDDGAPDGWVDLVDQAYDATLPTPSNTLYIRIYQKGNGTQNYFALWSATRGGNDPSSHISVTAQAAPESSVKPNK